MASGELRSNLTFANNQPILLLLGHINDSYLVIEKFNRKSKKFMYESISILRGNDGYMQHSSHCSDSGTTYYAVLSHNSDYNAEKDLYWHLEIFSTTTLQRTYYANGTIQNWSDAIELACIDNHTVTIFTGSSINREEFTVSKHTFMF